MLKKLYIEPTTKCNLNCKMCFRHTWFDEPICDLSLEDYRKVLETMPKSVETIFFGGMGEPLFHKDILTMIRLAAETGAEVELLTNGTLLTENMIHGILEAGLSKLWISIDDLETDSSINTDSDDADPEHSGHNHSGRVLSNIRLLNKIRQKSVNGKVIITYLTKENLKEFECTPKDLDGIVNQLRVTKDIEVAVFLYENEDQSYKASFRVAGDINVAEIAQSFGGGGHVKAAGCTITGSIEEIITRVLEAIQIRL